MPAVLAGAASAVLIGRALTTRRLRHDVVALFARVPDLPLPRYHEAALAGLPAPVLRYFRRVLSDGQPYLRGLRLQHTGQFKTDLQQAWVPITGE